MYYNIWASIEAVYPDENGEEDDYEDIDWPAKVGTYDTLEDALDKMKELDSLFFESFIIQEEPINFQGPSSPDAGEEIGT